MKPFVALWCLVLLAGSGAEASLPQARQAREMLGPDAWARVLRITNTNPRSPYPAEVYATVFEFNGILWFYTATDGTQSLSLHLGRLQRDKDDLQPLLAAIDPGFVRHEHLSDFGPRFAVLPPPLPKGCFVNCLAALRELLESDAPVTQEALLNYYFETGGRTYGHTVLVYATPDGVYFVDHDLSPRPRMLSVKLPVGDAMGTARAVQAAGGGRARMVSARWVGRPLVAPRPAPGLVVGPGPEVRSAGTG